MQAEFTHDDYPLASIPDTPLWSENYAFTLYAPQIKLGFMLLLGRMPEDPTVWREVVQIVLPDGRKVCAKNYGKAASDTVASASLFKLETLKPGHTFRLSYDGPAADYSHSELLKFGAYNKRPENLKLDIVYEAVSPVWDMSGHGDGAAIVAGSLHLEHVGKGSGQICFGEQEYHFSNAFMHRDHSRGPREPSLFHRHCWAQGWFPEQGLTFNVYHIEMFGKQGMSNASVSRGEQRYDATVKDIQLINGLGDEGKTYSISLESELGDMQLTRTRAASSILISFTPPWELYHGTVPGGNAAFTFEEGSHWTLGDGSEGIGWSERAFILERFSAPD